MYFAGFPESKFMVYCTDTYMLIQTSCLGSFNFKKFCSIYFVQILLHLNNFVSISLMMANVFLAKLETFSIISWTCSKLKNIASYHPTPDHLDIPVFYSESINFPQASLTEASTANISINMACRIFCCRAISDVYQTAVRNCSKK